MADNQQIPASRRQGNTGRQVQHESTANKKKSGGPWRVIFWIALIVLVGSLAALGVIAFSYFQNQQAYQEISEVAAVHDLEGRAVEEMTVDWDALAAINPDIVGWIYIPGTVVNYPIVQGSDNVKYLTYGFNGEEDFITYAGTIFLAAENSRDFSDQNNIVYGHHMNDGSMFSFLNTFTEQSVFDTNRTVYILTPKGNYKLKTFSMVVTTGTDTLVQPLFATPEDMTSYIQDKIDRSVVFGGVDAATIVERGRIFSFATCDYSITNGRSVLFASVMETTVEKNEKLGGELIAPEDAAAVENAAEEIQ